MKKNILLLDPGPDVGTGSTTESSYWFVFLKECSKCIKRNTLKSLAVIMLILFSNQLFAQHFGGLRTAVAANVQQKDPHKDPINPVKKDYERFVYEDNKFYKESSYSINPSALPLVDANTPCTAHRWTQGDGWRKNGTVWEAKDKEHDLPFGIVGCDPSAETETSVNTFKGAYDANAAGNPIPAVLPLTNCFNMDGETFGNTVAGPAQGEDIVWLNFDIRPLAGTYQFQVISNQVVGWVLFHVDPNFAQPVAGTPGTSYPPGAGVSGDCTKLIYSNIVKTGVTYPACGLSGNGWSTITVPSFQKPTNYYLAMWIAAPGAQTFPGNMNLNYKSRFGCGGSTCTLEHLRTDLACNVNSTYTACALFGGSAGRWNIDVHGGTNLSWTLYGEDGITQLGSGTTSQITLGIIPAGAVFAKICATYPINTAYDIQLTADPTFSGGTGYITCGDNSRATGASPTIEQLALDEPDPFCGSASNLNLNTYVTSPVPAGHTLSFWTNANPNVLIPNATASNYSVTQTTIIVVRLTNNVTGCADSELLTITVNPNPTANVNDAEVCDESTVQLSGTPPGGTWSGGAYIDSNGLFSAVGLSPGEYTVTYSYTDGNGCSDSDDAKVTVNPNPTASAEHTPILCFGGSSTLTVSGSGGTPPYTYSINGVDYFSLPGGNQFTVSASANPYTVYVKDSKGCIDTDTELVTQPDDVSPTITKDGDSFDDVCGKTAEQAQADVDAAFAAWLAIPPVVSGGTPPYGTVVQNPANPVAAPPYTGGSKEITWSVTDACGKADDVKATFTVINLCGIDCRTTPTPASCDGAANGTITAAASGGNAPYTFHLFLASDVTFSTELGGGPKTDNAAPIEPGEVIFNGLAAGTYVVLITDGTHDLEHAKVCENVTVERVASVDIVEHCTNDEITACSLTQAAIDADYLAWFNSLAPTGGTNLEYHIVVKNAQNQTVDEDGIFSPARCGAVYTATVTYEDDCAQSGDCTATYTVIGDTEKPVITPPENYTLPNCNQDWPSNVPADWTDNCGVQGQTSGTVDGIAGEVVANGCTQYRDYTFNITDGCGNAADQKVTRVTRRYDVTLPVIDELDDYTLPNCNQDWPANVATNWNDNCGVGGKTSGTVDGIAGTVVTNGCTQYRDYTFDLEDDCGNDAVQKVTRVTRRYDVTLPVIDELDDYTLPNCNQDWPANVATNWNDNCGVDGKTSGTVDGVAGEVVANGCTQYRDYTFNLEDDCGNDAVQKVTRVTRRYDVTLPVIDELDDYTLPNCNQDWPANVTTNWNDNCGVGGKTSGTINGIAGTVVTNGCTQYRDYTFDLEDDCGNDAVQKVTRVTRRYDVTIPVITPPDNYSLQGCNADWPSNVAADWSDNCGYQGQTSGTVNGTAGTVVTNGCSQYRDYTFNFTDDCGNAAAQKVTRVSRTYDVTDPVVACPSNIAQGVCDFTPLVVPRATDNCDTSVTVVATRSDGLALNAPFPVGQTITVTYTATDDCGNDASCSFTVLLRDCGKSCTPGFWKNHKEVWNAQNDFTVNNMPGSLPSTPGNTFITTTNFWTYFNIPVNTGGISNKANLDMLGATGLGGGGCKALARHGVSALLGAAAFPGEYPYPAGTNSFATLYNLIRNSLLGTAGYPTCDQLATTLANINNLDGPFCSALSQLPPASLQAVYTQVESSMFKAYPVPFKEYINVQYEFDYHSKARIEVYDAKGIFVMSYDDDDAYFNKEVRLDVNFNQGDGQMYIIKVITDKEVGTKRIISKK